MSVCVCEFVVVVIWKREWERDGKIEYEGERGERGVRDRRERERERERREERWCEGVHEGSYQNKFKKYFNQNKDSDIFVALLFMLPTICFFCSGSLPIFFAQITE